MSNTSRNSLAAPAELAALGIEPMSARSVVLSALLGTHPPTLPARSLIALSELFGIRAGTVRTSLSRMVTNGELTGADGKYGLAGRLLERQRQQDGGQPSSTDWNGDWITAIAATDRRSMAERRAFRETMVGARLAELRPDIWMRPANTPGPQRSSGTLVTTGPLDFGDVDNLVRRLWQLDTVEQTATQLFVALDRQRSAIDGGDTALLPQTFMISAAVVRFLRVEPQLPAALTPPAWTAPKLRALYAEVNTAFLGQLRAFFKSVD